MSHAAAIVILVFCAGAALGALALFVPRASAPPADPPPVPKPWHSTTGWTTQAGEDFSGLSEAARCDLVFAVSDLRDERSQQLLVHALDDPSDAVALAAAHSLASRGAAGAVNAYAQAHPGQRAQRILDTLALLQ